MKYLIKIYNHFFIFILFLPSIYFSQNYNNEKLVYDIDFRFFSAGETTFETQIDILNNQEVFKMAIKG